MSRRGTDIAAVTETKVCPMSHTGRPSFGPRVLIPARVPIELNEQLIAIGKTLGIPKGEVAVRLIAAAIEDYDVAELPKIYHSNKCDNNQELPMTG